MGLLEALLMTHLAMNAMVQISQVGPEVPSYWPMDAAQDLQARAECIHINDQILLTDLHMFSYSISWENLLKDQSNFFVVII